jgi:hypothetical protein
VAAQRAGWAAAHVSGCCSSVSVSTRHSWLQNVASCNGVDDNCEYRMLCAKGCACAEYICKCTLHQPSSAACMLYMWFIGSWPKVETSCH